MQEFERNAECTGKNCFVPCKAYIKLKMAYLKRKEVQFLMQPLGVTSKDIGKREKRTLKLQYNIVEQKFFPSEKEKYSIEEREFLKHHIDMFHLNAVEYKSKQLICFLEDTVQNEGNYSKMDYNNQIVELFVKQILEGKTKQEILKICEKLYTYAVLKFNVLES